MRRARTLTRIVAVRNFIHSGWEVDARHTACQGAHVTRVGRVVGLCYAGWLVSCRVIGLYRVVGLYRLVGLLPIGWFIDATYRIVLVSASGSAPRARPRDVITYISYSYQAHIACGCKSKSRLATQLDQQQLQSQMKESQLQEQLLTSQQAVGVK